MGAPFFAQRRVGDGSSYNRPRPIPVHRDRRPVVEFVITVATPSPLFRTIHEPSRHRVLMCVVEFFVERVFSRDVEVIGSGFP